MTKQDAQKFIMAGIYNASKPYFINNFNDDFASIKRLLNDILKVTGVEDVEIMNKRVETFKDLDNDSMSVTKFILDIKTKFGDLRGLISCCPQKEGYNMVVSVWQKSDLVAESYICESKSLPELYKEFKQQLKDAVSKADTEKVIKRFVGLGIGIGLVLQVISCCYETNKLERERIIAMIEKGNVPYEYYIEHQAQFEEIYREYYDIDEDGVEYVDDEAEPEWEPLDIPVTVTVYNAKPSQCNRDVQHTASMFKLDLKNPAAHKIIAMDRGMMQEYGFRYGDLVKIEGTSHDGVYQIQDTMNKRYNNQNCIDILMNNDTTTGKWQNATIYRLENKEECAKQLKSSMKPAKNQAKIDARQG